MEIKEALSAIKTIEKFLISLEESEMKASKKKEKNEIIKTCEMIIENSDNEKTVEFAKAMLYFYELHGKLSEKQIESLNRTRKVVLNSKRLK